MKDLVVNFYDTLPLVLADYRDASSNDFGDYWKKVFTIYENAFNCYGGTLFEEWCIMCLEEFSIIYWKAKKEWLENVNNL